MGSENEFQSMASMTSSGLPMDEEEDTEPAVAPAKRSISLRQSPQILRSEAVNNFKELHGEWNKVIYNSVFSTANKSLPELTISDLAGF